MKLMVWQKEKKVEKAKTKRPRQKKGKQTQGEISDASKSTEKNSEISLKLNANKKYLPKPIKNLCVRIPFTQQILYFLFSLSAFQFTTFISFQIKTTKL